MHGGGLLSSLGWQPAASLMRSVLVVADLVDGKDLMRVGFPGDEDVVEDVAPDGADDAFAAFLGLARGTSRVSQESEGVRTGSMGVMTPARSSTACAASRIQLSRKRPPMI